MKVLCRVSFVVVGSGWDGIIVKVRIRDNVTVRYGVNSGRLGLGFSNVRHLVSGVQAESFLVLSC